jgi:hypothetical protein
MNFPNVSGWTNYNWYFADDGEGLVIGRASTAFGAELLVYENEDGTYYWEGGAYWDRLPISRDWRNHLGTAETAEGAVKAAEAAYRLAIS